MLDVTLVSNAGGGETKHLRVAEGTTVGQFLDVHVGRERDNYDIRVNYNFAQTDDLLEDDSMVVVTPTKFEGAF